MSVTDVACQNGFKLAYLICLLPVTSMCALLQTPTTTHSGTTVLSSFKLKKSNIFGTRQPRVCIVENRSEGRVFEHFHVQTPEIMNRENCAQHNDV